MKELYDLKDLYLEEIKKISKKGELTPSDAEAAKIALEAIEKIEEVCDLMEEEEGMYSERGRSYARGRNQYSNNMARRSYMPEMYYAERNQSGNNSFRRGRSSTTGRYISRHGGEDEYVIDDIIAKLEAMKDGN